MDQRTLTLCPECRRVIDGKIYEKRGDVYISCVCPDHGPFDNLYYKDAGLYRKVSSLVDGRTICRELRCAQGIPCQDHLVKTYNIMVEVTQRCNMDCPVCFADTGHEDCRHNHKDPQHGC